jgi:hypothetical protein
MITFDSNGNPHPYEVVNVSYTYFKTTYVESFIGSDTRSAICRSYETYIDHFRQIIDNEFTHWLGGSFTTTKVDPNDIDVVNLVTFTEEVNGKIHLLLRFLTNGGSKDTYSVDGYCVPLYPESDPRYEFTKQQLQYWSDWFGHDRVKRPKAIIEISIF